ncbi:hypothetical protein ACGFYE_04890 [Streptomyces zaomyceticus]|uniref:hypothetical protein n=1 Tax=Streptomyces zaomyceticus TaxID=68286 RepID=UPI003723E0B4
MSDRTAANRTVLALTGLALLTAGIAATRQADDRILTAAVRHLQQADHRLLLAAGSAGLAAALALLAAQIPRPAPRRLDLSAPGCRLDRRAVRHATQVGCAAVPGVLRARCRLTGNRRMMQMSLTLTVNSTAHPGDVLTAVSDSVLAQITPLLTPRRLHTRIRLHVPSPRSRRAL